MDNISRRLSSEDTAASMYLSFDAESTMSTACYKTLEAMSDISALSAIDMDNSVNKTGENHLNSTLEAQDNSQNISPLKTVKKMEMPEMKLNTPLRALPKNILKEYKALCSTPSKEQLLKSVDVTRGSDATRCVDLGLAFLGVDDEKPAYFPPPPPAASEENKENALPETEEVSTLSTCSSVEITATSVIERKMLSSVSTVGSITEEESVDEVKIIKNIEEIIISTETVEESKAINNSLLEDANVVEIENANVKDLIKQSNENTPKAKLDNKEFMATITEIEDKAEDKTPIVKELDVAKKSVNKKSISKPKIAVLTRNVRRSICEPNLQTNKPARLLNSGYKRKSLLPTSRKSTINMDAELEIPLLMNKILKITNDNATPMVTEEVEQKEQQQLQLNEQKTNNVEKRRSVMTTMKTRTSLIPSAATTGDKRPFSFTQRMSVVVKTTLNSPARKMARKSSIGVMSSMPRRSVIPQKTTESSKLKKPEVIARKSMLPRTSAISTTTKPYTKPMATLQESSITNPTAITQRKSLYPLSKDSEKGKASTVGVALNKTDISFTCNVCKEKFRIKSLLDAHKRSHESDNVTPAFIKKPTATPLPSSGSSNANQCKYCDKKFALTKALHIHLLQNCSKIPPSEKRKLQYTDLNHVEKAQLPNVFAHHHHNVQSNASSAASSAYATPRHAVKSNINSTTLPKSSTESINENKDIQKITSELVTTVDGTIMTTSQNSVKKIIKKTAHAGVYRTPSKSVPCHLCKLTFKSILDYTNHNLTVHASSKNITEDIGNDLEVEEKVATTIG